MVREGFKSLKGPAEGALPWTPDQPYSEWVLRNVKFTRTTLLELLYLADLYDRGVSAGEIDPAVRR